MSLNPAAKEFKPQPDLSNPITAQEDVPIHSATTIPDIIESDYPTARQMQYHIYQDKRRAIIHTIMREGFTSAQIHANDDNRVHDENVKDKLILHFSRLLAGLGCPTSTSIRAAVLLEVDQARDALDCLEQAKEMGEEFHKKRAEAARKSQDEGKEGEVH